MDIIQEIIPIIPTYSVNKPIVEIEIKGKRVKDMSGYQELFRIVCKSVCNNFIIDYSNKEIVNEIYLYLNGVSNKYDSRKGLWLWGGIGTGKSTILKICREYHYYSKAVRSGVKSGNNAGGFSIISASRLVNEFARTGLDGIDKYGYNKNLPLDYAFDEVGREPIPAKYFGTEMNVMQFIFQTRYEYREMCKTFVSTNMKESAISKVYGEYIADRVKEMFNVIEIAGTSRR